MVINDIQNDGDAVLMGGIDRSPQVRQASRKRATVHRLARRTCPSPATWKMAIGMISIALT